MSYRELAWDYDWLVSDELRGGRVLRAQFADVFSRLSPKSLLLDCACGTGWNVVALSKAGFEVVGSDASGEMIDRARSNAAACRVNATFEVARWTELPERMRRRFAAVLCVGNSIVHADGERERVAALAAMRLVLQPGGWLLLDSRDWEADWRPGRKIEVPDRFVQGDRVRCLPIRIWDTPADFHAIHHLEFLLIFETEDGVVTSRRHRLAFIPFRLKDLTRALDEAGFQEATYVSEHGWLSVTARNPARASVGTRA